MNWLLIALFAAFLAARSDDGRSPPKPALLLHDQNEGRLLTLSDGSLALIARDRLQFRSPAGKWSEVVKLPLDYVIESASDDSGVLVSGDQPVSPPYVTMIFLVGVDGQIRETWKLPDECIYSLAAWKGQRFATGLRQTFELLPGGRIGRDLVTPTVVRYGYGPDGSLAEQPIVPQWFHLYLGPEGEKVYCVSQQCHHDGPCHYAYCYRRDQVSWDEFGRWSQPPVGCGDYLLEPETSGSADYYLPHHHNRTVVRRMADGIKIASVKMAQDSVIACGNDDEFLVADTSIKAFQMTTGRRLWSVPVRSGTAVAVARANDCVVALTNRGKEQHVCRQAGHSPGQNTSKILPAGSHGRNP
jgi:hypothetical protein